MQRGKLVRAGADRVLSPHPIGDLQLAQTALRPAVVAVAQLATGSDNLDLNTEQVRIAEGSSLADRCLVDATLRQRSGVVVVGIQRAAAGMAFTPSPESVVAGDFLVVLGQATPLRELGAEAWHRIRPAFGR